MQITQKKMCQLMLILSLEVRFSENRLYSQFGWIRMDKSDFILNKYDYNIDKSR